MNNKEIIKRFAAGLFFIIGIILILVIVFFIGLERGITQPKFQVTVIFRNVGGLAIGAPVRLSGVEVGNVAHIDFLEGKINDRGVRVILNIFKKYKKQIEYCSIYSIKLEGILGEKLVEISPPGESKTCDLNKPIIGQDPLDVQNLAMAFNDTALSLTNMTKDMSFILDELKYFSRASKRVLDRIEDRLIEGNLLKIF